MENEMLNEQILDLQKENARLLALIEEKNHDCEQAKKFLEEFPCAEEFVDDICLALEQGDTADEYALLYAFAKVLSQKYVQPQKLAEDEDFLKANIYTNDKIREFFVKEFLEKVKKAPVGCLKRGGIPTTSAEKPKTIALAGEMAKALFRK